MLVEEQLSVPNGIKELAASGGVISDYLIHHLELIFIEHIFSHQLVRIFKHNALSNWMLKHPSNVDVLVVIAGRWRWWRW